MVQTAQYANGQDTAPPQFQYGIDPREYGMSKADYEMAMERHRHIEHMNIMDEQHDRHMKAMDWNAAERVRIDAEWELKNWWLQPLNACCKWVGGAFWVVVWFVAFISVSTWIHEVNKRADDAKAKATITSCLADLDKCRADAGGRWMKEAVR